MTATWQLASRPATGIGRTIRQHRERLRLSQSDLGRLARLDRSLISHIESGSRTVTLETVSAICDALGLGEVDRMLLMAEAGYIEYRLSPAACMVILREYELTQQIAAD